MNINILTILRWLIAHWGEISQFLKRVIELVIETNGMDASGNAKRYSVFQAILSEFPNFSDKKSLINTAIELCVAVLRWKGVLK